MTYIVSGGALNSTHSLTPQLSYFDTQVIEITTNWKLELGQIATNLT